jgi:hypothetical protein
LLPRLILEAVGELALLTPLGGLDATLGELLLKLSEAHGVLTRQRDPVLQVLRPEVRRRVPRVDPLRLVRDTVARRRALSHPKAVIPVQLVLDANLGVEVAPTLLVLAPSLGVNRVPHDVDVRVFFVAVNETGVVMTGGKSLGQLRADFKQGLVRDLLGVGIRRIEVVARVVVLATTFVIELLPRLVPRPGNLLFALEPKVVRPGNALLVALLVHLAAEVFDAGGGRWSRCEFEDAHSASSSLCLLPPPPMSSTSRTSVCRDRVTSSNSPGRS